MRIFAIVVCFPLCFSYDNVVFNFIADYLKSQTGTSVLTIPNDTCWEMKKLYHLHKRVHALKYLTKLNLSMERTNHLVILADLSCLNTLNFLRKANEDGYFKSPYRWLWLVHSSSFQDPHEILTQLLKSVDILVDSHVIIAERIGDAFKLSEAYKVASSLEVIQEQIGTWSAGVLETYTRPGHTPQWRRRNLRGHTIVVANVINDSNDTKHHLEDRMNLHQDSITKMSWLAGKTCIESLNASARAVFAPTWGYKDRAGRWNGMIYNMTQGQVDLGTILIFTKERSELIQYVSMVGATSVRFVFRQPPLSHISNIYSLPFSKGVWLSTLVCAAACAALLFYTSQWEVKMVKHQNQLSGSWGDALLVTVSAILQQGCVLEPRQPSGRILTLFLFAVLMALYAAYSANIVVLLRAPATSVITLPDLLRSPLDCGASDIEYNKYFLENLNEPVRKMIYEKKIAPKGRKPHFYSMKDGVEMIRKGLFAFHMEVNPGYRLIQDTYQENEKCDLVEIDYINEFDPWMPAQRGSPYIELFKISLYRYRESGLQQANHRRLTVARPKCSGVVVSFVSVGITDTYPGLLLMLYGFLLAVLVLLMEVVIYKAQEEKKKRKYAFIDCKLSIIDT